MSTESDRASERDPASDRPPKGWVVSSGCAMGWGWYSFVIRDAKRVVVAEPTLAGDSRIAARKLAVAMAWRMDQKNSKPSDMT